MAKWLILKLGQRKYKMSLECLVTAKRKDMLKKKKINHERMVNIKRIQVSASKSSQ